MTAVSVSTRSNAARIKVSGRLNAEEWINVLNLLDAASRDLDPGWTAAIDARGLDLLDFDDLSLHAGMLRAIYDCGGGRVVMLFSDALTALQDKRVARESGTNDITARYFNESAWRASFARVA